MYIYVYRYIYIYIYIKAAPEILFRKCFFLENICNILKCIHVLEKLTDGDKK